MPGDVRGSTFQFTPGGGLQIGNATLKGIIIETAYDVRDFQIFGGNAWLDADRFDISARSSSGASIPEVRQKLQSLLAERFRLLEHRETRELAVYALHLAKSGARLKPLDARQPVPANAGIRTACGQMTGTSAAIANLTFMISRQLGRPVLDRTALTGRYDFELRSTPDAGACPGEAEGGPSIFTALQEQLGLKLDATKGPVEVIVIDSAEKPTAN